MACDAVAGSPLNRSFKVKLGVGVGLGVGEGSEAIVASALRLLYSWMLVKGIMGVPIKSPSKLLGMLTGLLVTLLGGHTRLVVIRLRGGITGGGLSCWGVVGGGGKLLA